MEDRLQDRARGICDVSILPVEGNGVGGAVEVPEAQCASASRYRELLIEGAVSVCLAPREAAKAIGCVARESGKSAAVRLRVRHYRRRVVTVNYPWWETASLESFVLNEAGITDASHVIVIPRESGVRIAKRVGDRPGGNTRRQRA